MSLHCAQLWNPYSRIHTWDATTRSHLSQWMRWLLVQAAFKELEQSLHGSDSIEEQFCTLTEGNEISQIEAMGARMAQQGTSYYQRLRCGICCSISVLQGCVARFSIWFMWYWVPIEYHIYWRKWNHTNRGYDSKNGTTGYSILSVVKVWHMLQHFCVARLCSKLLNMVHVILSSHWIPYWHPILNDVEKSLT
jgi:hypothetical protein